jgi:hypothetical protein
VFPVIANHFIHHCHHHQHHLNHAAADQLLWQISMAAVDRAGYSGNSQKQGIKPIKPQKDG